MAEILPGIPATPAESAAATGQGTPDVRAALGCQEQGGAGANNDAKRNPRGKNHAPVRRVV